MGATYTNVRQFSPHILFLFIHFLYVFFFRTSQPQPQQESDMAGVAFQRRFHISVDDAVSRNSTSQVRLDLFIFFCTNTTETNSNEKKVI